MADTDPLAEALPCECDATLFLLPERHDRSCPWRHSDAVRAYVEADRDRYRLAWLSARRRGRRTKRGWEVARDANGHWITERMRAEAAEAKVAAVEALLGRDWGYAAVGDDDIRAALADDEPVVVATYNPNADYEAYEARAEAAEAKVADVWDEGEAAGLRNAEAPNPYRAADEWIGANVRALTDAESVVPAADRSPE